MKKLLFCAESTWELYDLLPVANYFKKHYPNDFSCSFICDDSFNQEIASHYGYDWVKDYDNYDVLIAAQMHVGFVRDLSERFFNRGKICFLIQHGHDNQLYKINYLLDRNKPIVNFHFMCVAGVYDKQIMEPSLGNKVIATGIPRLDDLKGITQEEIKHIYKKLNTNDFWLVAFPGFHLIDEALMNEFFVELPKLLDGQGTLVYKTHPGSQVSQFEKYNKNNSLIIETDYYDYNNTFKLISASKGIVCCKPYSFMAIEASLLKKPAICIGNYTEEFSEGYEEGSEPIYFDHNLLSSTPDNPTFNDYQRYVASLYLYDGNNTKRVVDLIVEKSEIFYKTKNVLPGKSNVHRNVQLLLTEDNMSGTRIILEKGVLKKKEVSALSEIEESSIDRIESNFYLHKIEPNDHKKYIHIFYKALISGGELKITIFDFDQLMSVYTDHRANIDLNDLLREIILSRTGNSNLDFKCVLKAQYVYQLLFDCGFSEVKVSNSNETKGDLPTVVISGKSIKA